MKNVVLGLLVLLLVGCETPPPPPSFVSESTVVAYDFESGIDSWDAMSYGFEANSTTAHAHKGTRALHIYNRIGQEFSAGARIEPSIEANTTYVVRGYIRHGVADTNQTYTLNAKIGTYTYRPYGRINASSSAWVKFRSYVRFSQSDIDANITLYFTSDTNTSNFYIDDITLVKSAYTPPQTLGTKPLGISGRHIVDANGATVRLKGINLNAYDDDQSTNPETFMNYTYNNYDKEDFAHIKALGFNAVRLNLWYAYFEEDNNTGAYLDRGFDWLDTIIGWAKEAGLYVMLDMHAPQGGGFQGPSNVTAFWNTTDYQTRYINLWKALAQRYRYESAIAAYDILNEPCPNTQSAYIDLAQKTVDAIRTIDTYHICNVEHSFATYSTYMDINGTNILYDFHFYDPWNEYTNHASAVYGVDVNYTQLRTLFYDLAQHYIGKNQAFNVSEFGQTYAKFQDKNASGWISDTLKLFDESGANYFYFNYRGTEFSLHPNGTFNYYPDVPTNESLQTLLQSALGK